MKFVLPDTLTQQTKTTREKGRAEFAHALALLEVNDPTKHPIALILNCILYHSINN